MDYIISDIYDGRKRKLFSIACETCGKEVFLPKHVISGRKHVHCSRECYNKSRTRKDRECSFCHSVYTPKSSNLESKSGFYFCSRRCKDLAQSVDSGDIFDTMRPDHYQNGVRQYRKRLIRWGDVKLVCNICGIDSWNGKELSLEVHHVDGNRFNPSLDNLQILCPNCHSQTKNYRQLGVKRARNSMGE